jgi:DnaK suppressor protein
MVRSAVAEAEYRPTEAEPFMNPRQREYFRRKLENWRDEILRESRETLENLQEESQNHPDMADRASSESDRALELRTRDRQRKLISKIDAALKRIEDGTYGYCEETGDPIGIARLDARPIATLSLEAQEMHERREKVYRDEYTPRDDDKEGPPLCGPFHFCGHRGLAAFALCLLLGGSADVQP